MCVIIVSNIIIIILSNATNIIGRHTRVNFLLSPTITPACHACYGAAGQGYPAFVLHVEMGTISEHVFLLHAMNELEWRATKLVIDAISRIPWPFH